MWHSHIRMKWILSWTPRQADRKAVLIFFEWDATKHLRVFVVEVLHKECGNVRFRVMRIMFFIVAELDNRPFIGVAIALPAE